MRHFKRIIIVIVFLGVLGSALAGYFLVLTPAGAAAALRYYISRHERFCSITFEKVDGNFIQGLTIKNIRLAAVKRFPVGSTIKIPELFVHLTSLEAAGLTVTVENARIKLPESDPILIFGKFQGGVLDINLYSNQIDVHEILGLFPDTPALLKKADGVLREADLLVKGPLSALDFTGKVYIEELLFKNFSAKDGSATCSLRVEGIGRELKVFGQVLLADGTLAGAKTATINLKPSKIFFSGSPRNPRFEVNGAADVSGVKINVGVRETLQKPDVQVSSRPSLPRDELLVMLLTNQRWKATEDALNKGQVSADMAKDFIDYFAFGGKGSKLARQLGIKDVTIKLDSQTKGIGITKNVVHNVDASYGIEQTQLKPGTPPDTKHTLGGQYNVNENISIEVERKITQPNPATQAATNIPLKPDDQILLKFKKEF